METLVLYITTGLHSTKHSIPVLVASHIISVEIINLLTYNLTK